MKGDPLRRVSYSLVGLLAGNVALFIFLLLYSQYRGRFLDGQLRFHFWQQVEAFSVVTMFSIVGWLIIGVPTVLALSSEATVRLPPFALLPLGAFLGPLALFSILLLGRGRIAGIFGGMGTLWLYSAIVSTVAFAVHCLLLRRYTRSIQGHAG